MEVEAAYRTLQYKYDQECEARRVSEALHEQLKEQIARSDEKFAKYVNRKIKITNNLLCAVVFKAVARGTV